MAVIPKSEIILGGRTQLPTGIYGVMLETVEVKTGQKEGARPTLRVKCKIIAPLTIEVAGETHNIAGRTFDMMPNLIDPSVEYGLGKIVQGLQVSGFDFEKFGAGGDIDDEKFHVLTGHKMQMSLSSYEAVKNRPATPEELAANPAERYIPQRDLKGNVITAGWFICSPVMQKGQHVSAGWQDVVGPCDVEGLF